MQKLFLVLSFAFLAAGASASWYWPFGDSDEEKPRLSDLVRTASDLISEASDLASDGKSSEAVAKYREALVELDRVERENPDLTEGVAQGTFKTKRAYVEAAIDALLLNQARENAKPVAVSDTAELEKRLAAERSGQKAPAAEEPLPEVKESTEKPEAKKSPAKPAAKPPAAAAPVKKPAPKRPLTPREEVLQALSEADYAKADKLIAAMLEARPNDAAALNLRAAKEAAEGKFREAENTLDAAIRSNPRDYFAYYNMAVLKLQTRKDDRDGARRYYETGRTLGGPADAEIEEMLK